MKDMVKKDPVTNYLEPSATYLSNLTSYMNSQKILTEEDEANIKTQLWELLSRQTNRYTMGDHSSVPIETAKELLESINFTIAIYLKDMGDYSQSAFLMKNINLSELFKKGQRVIEEKIAEGKVLLEKVMRTRLAVDNFSYEDTIREISSFFKKYDYRFMAHEIPCYIDYQLFSPMPELSGVEYINEYLSRLLWENEFCRYFYPKDIIRLLMSYCRDYREELINIFDPVFTNALGLKLIKKDIRFLNISDFERKMLYDLISSWEDNEIKNNIFKAIQDILIEAGIDDESAVMYFNEGAKDIISRLMLQKDRGLKNIFISFKEPEASEGNVKYYDGEQMDDEELRKIIDELSACRFLSDKIAMIKRHIHSINDLVEVLNTCFWEEDSIEVFKLLSEPELALLFRHIDERKENYSDSLELEYPWEGFFMKYIESLEEKKLKLIYKMYHSINKEGM